MTDNATPPTAADRFLRHRRWFEVGFWVVAVSLSAIGNTITVSMEMTRAGLPHHPLEPAIWEWSSNLVLLALVPAIVVFTRRFPLHLDTWRRQLPWYVVASAVYSVLHVLAMVAVRKAVYAAAGEVRRQLAVGRGDRPVVEGHGEQVARRTIPSQPPAFYAAARGNTMQGQRQFCQKIVRRMLSVPIGRLD